MKTEAEMWVEIRKTQPIAERVENSIKVGTPDVMYPVKNNWVFLELKVLRGTYIFCDKFQLGFIVKSMKTQQDHSPLWCVWHTTINEYSIYTGKEVLALDRAPVNSDKPGKIKLKYDEGKETCKLVDLNGKIELYSIK